ncbi:MAG: DUF167 domain-containing protein [Solirubrobacterales bacterium]|nr:DUF167 domain-containing protein [Solirubrobacterales bacterium]
MAAHLDVRVVARAAREEIAGERGGRLVVRVTAPPIEGRANAAVCRLVAKALGAPKSSVTVARGQTARDKQLAVADMDDGEVRQRLGL